MTTYSLLIREFHLDTLGHMNNATYLSLFEEARWEAVSAKGYNLHHIQKVKKGPVILEVNLKFIKEVTLRELVTIKTELLSYEGKIGKLRQGLYKQDGMLAAEAIFTFGLFDLETRKLVSPTEEWIKAISWFNN